VLITEPARQAGRPASRWRRTLGDPRPGVPRSPHHAAQSARRLHRHRLRRLLPDPGHRAGHTPPASEPGTEGQPRDRSDRRVQPGVGLDRRRHLQPPRAGTPCQSTRYTTSSANSVHLLSCNESHPLSTPTASATAASSGSATAGPTCTSNLKPCYVGWASSSNELVPAGAAQSTAASAMGD